MLSNVLFILLGAGLVSVGVLVTAIATAFADRIRGGQRAGREAAPRDRASRVQSAPTVAPPAIQVVEPAELFRSAPAVKPRANRTESREPKPSTEGGEDVIAALVAAGYKKPIATESTWACSAGERATIEGWTAAALRRCVRGGMS